MNNPITTSCGILTQRKSKLDRLIRASAMSSIAKGEQLARENYSKQIARASVSELVRKPIGQADAFF